MTNPLIRRHANRLLPRVDGAQPAGRRLLQSDAATLSVSTSTTATAPVYSVFPLSVSLTTTLASSLVHIYAYIAWSVTGVASTTANFRFLLNGVLIPTSRATSEFSNSSQIATVSYSRLLTVAAGVQIVTFEWANQAGGGTLSCTAGGPSIFPDVFGANLKVEEFAA